MTPAIPRQDLSTPRSIQPSGTKQYDSAAWIESMPARPSTASSSTSYCPGSLEHDLALAYFTGRGTSHSEDGGGLKRPPSLPPLPFQTSSLSPGLLPTLTDPSATLPRPDRVMRTSRPLSFPYSPSPHKSSIPPQPPALILPPESPSSKALSSSVPHITSSNGADSLRKTAITQSALLHTPQQPELSHPPDPSAYLAVFDDEEMRRCGEGIYDPSHSRSPSSASSHTPFLGPGSTSAYATHFSPASSSSSLSNASSLVGRATGRVPGSWGLHPGALLFLTGFILFPLWWVGALLPIRPVTSTSPSEKSRIRQRYGGEAAARRVARRWRTYNRYMSVFSLLLVIGAVALIIWWLKGDF
ncbi:hypothetical protein BJ684DRAFT_14899 [Piptocephalis cylindrospora]|uniref:Serine-rich protein n=1 Tax=Piptocephalis cylindrospora TaxID=1907219 RepID=A0A4P9Y6S6_9FUNG|nr:hypothetical protein BJ684DRAFT_14899 [Piptocephalis cylindrospora]|eukprot:RKP14798.1 hypothetical protein BJ684DRAFT_14899 [Piptocephalis cylindrospora]